LWPQVLSEMQKKLRYNPADKFVCLVVEPASASGGGGGGVVGVVEVSFIAEKEILASLEAGTQGFPYIASMAVDPGVRRQGAATAMLGAAQGVAGAWRERQALLHVYQDNAPAVDLYRAAGYETIFADASWWAKLAVRPRFLMRKRFPAL
jgi:ribosomal protein S18 acetylase RimI-like enzyme